jgi:biopolymer transport protein ExbD/biopolymer transport protein TolR
MGATVEASSKGGKKKGPAPDINITPLVDIVLVLLIIFMVVTPQLEAGENVEMPSIHNVDAKSKSKLDPITITYTLSGRYFIEKDPIADADALKQRLEREHAVNPNRRLILKGDSRQQFVKMREVFALLAKSGFQGVSLMVGERPKDGPHGAAWVEGVSGVDE